MGFMCTTAHTVTTYGSLFHIAPLVLTLLVFFFRFCDVLLCPFNRFTDNIPRHAPVLPVAIRAQPAHLQLEGLILSLVVQGVYHPGQLPHTLPHVNILGLVRLVQVQLLHLGLPRLPTLPRGASEILVGDAGRLHHVQRVLLGLRVVRRQESRGAERAERAVEGEVMDVGRHSVGEDGGRDLGAVTEREM